MLQQHARGSTGGIISGSILVLTFFAIPNFIEYKNKARGLPGIGPGIKITRSEKVGNYDIFVLEARDSETLNVWLKNNDLGELPQDSVRIVDNYIEDGWEFVLAKLQTFSDGHATPHPILLQFQTGTPLYPMKLTAVPGSELHFELFMVAEKEAVPLNFNLKKEYCNYFDYKAIDSFRMPHDPNAEKGFVPRVFMGLDMEIAHKEALKVMWDGCVVTKFKGRIKPGQMQEDMLFDFKEPVPARSEIHSLEGKQYEAFLFTCILLSIASILISGYFCSKKKPGYKIPYIKIILFLFLISAAGYGINYSFIGEKVEVYSPDASGYRDTSSRLYDLLSIPNHSGLNGEELIELLIKEGIKNPMTGESIILEDSPGNITVENVGNYIRFKFYQANGSFRLL